MNLAKLLSSGKSWIKQTKNIKTVGLVVLAALLITSFFKTCSKKTDVKDCTAEVEHWQDLYNACDTAKIEITRLQAETQNRLENIQIPDPVEVFPNFDTEIQKLKSQVTRNKLKQVVLIGDKVTDSIAFQLALNECKAENDTLFARLQEVTNLSNDQQFRIDQLTAMLSAKSYSDSILREDYTARYEIKTNGELADFALAVDVNPILATRTIRLPPTPDELKAAAKDLAKNNFIALKGGILFKDNLSKSYYIPSIEVGLKRWLFEAGFLLDDSFKFDYKDFEAKAGFKINF